MDEKYDGELLLAGAGKGGELQIAWFSSALTPGLPVPAKRIGTCACRHHGGLSSQRKDSVSRDQRKHFLESYSL